MNDIVRPHPSTINEDQYHYHKGKTKFPNRTKGIEKNSVKKKYESRCLRRLLFRVRHWNHFITMVVPKSIFQSKVGTDITGIKFNNTPGV